MFEDQGVGDDEHQHDRQPARFQQSLFGVGVEPDRYKAVRFRQDRMVIVIAFNIFERSHVAIDEICHQEGIDGGDGGSFGRCKKCRHRCRQE